MHLVWGMDPTQNEPDCYLSTVYFPCGILPIYVSIDTGDSVTIEYTGRLDDETVFDTSREPVANEAGLAEAQSDREYTPLTVNIGDEQVIKGLEEGLVGLEAGETATLTIPPENAYGEAGSDSVQEFKTEDFKQMLGGQTPKEGFYIKAQNGSQGEVIHVDEETVRVDFNLRLAGETLTIDIEIIDVN